MKMVNFPLDKKKWRPSLIPGVIVLISTYNLKKIPNIAPKSWLQMVSFNPPILMFSGTQGNTTEQNIIENQCFGVNFVDSSMATPVYKSIEWFGLERIEKTGFSITPASKINAPLVTECKAHLECQLRTTQTVGNGFVIYGEIVAASIWEKILKIDHEKKYELLDLIFFLEDDTFAGMNHIQKI